MSSPAATRDLSDACKFIFMEIFGLQRLNTSSYKSAVRQEGLEKECRFITFASAKSTYTPKPIAHENSRYQQHR